MAPPTAEQVKVATEALRKEAGVWDEESAEMTKIADKADGLRLTRIEAGVFQVIFDAYGLAIDQIIARSHEGSERMSEVGRTLRSVADTYESEETAKVHKLKNIY
ncbi:hypothetical protein [Actinocrispum sp. NPDC049592]|uniref:hypothetical protein n=1 Tax=Actinocrispum sp. NPDC049592 TaxID=3154835 RepID=UPI00343717F3